MKYKRVLLKLSGEQFAGGSGIGIDSDFVNQLAQDIKQLIKETGIELTVVVGGGNFVRGKDMKVRGLKEETAHYMGMISTMLNGLALKDVLGSIGQPAYVQSRLGTEVADGFEPSKAIKELKVGKVVIILGGTGKPFVTTDTGAVQAAAALGCEVVLKATKVDGVYDKDPAKHKDAKKFDSLSHEEASAHPDINVMDNEAHDQAKSYGLPIIVFELSKENLIKVAQGKPVGTKVSA